MELTTLKTLCDEYAIQCRTYIVNRTFNNKDVDNHSFKPYSPQYAKQKGVSIDDVDLYSKFEHKHMLDSIEINISDIIWYTDGKVPKTNTIEIDLEIAGEADIRNKYNEMIGREWFGIDDAESQAVWDKLTDKPLLLIG